MKLLISNGKLKCGNLNNISGTTKSSIIRILIWHGFFSPLVLILKKFPKRGKGELKNGGCTYQWSNIFVFADLFDTICEFDTHYIRNNNSTQFYYPKRIVNRYGHEVPRFSSNKSNPTEYEFENSSLNLQDWRTMNYSQINGKFSPSIWPHSEFWDLPNTWRFKIIRGYYCSKYFNSLDWSHTTTPETHTMNVCSQLNFSLIPNPLMSLFNIMDGYITYKDSSTYVKHNSNSIENATLKM